MIQTDVDDISASRDWTTVDADPGMSLPAVVQYGLTLAMVIAAVFLAWAASQAVPAPGLTLIFVLPVVVAGTAFGLGASLFAGALGLLAFDFFFTPPYFTFRMTDPSDIWAAVLLLLTAGIVSSVSWTARQRALDARRAADRARALQAMAHAVIEGASEREVVQAAATALGAIFAAPAAVLARRDGTLTVQATTPGATLSAAEIQATRAAADACAPARAETYPHVQSRFDFWPVAVGRETRFVLGVDFSHGDEPMPPDSDRFVEIVSGYLAMVRVTVARTGHA